MTDTKIKHKCPPHHWIVDPHNIGHCKHCPAVRDFGEEQDAWFRRHRLQAILVGHREEKRGGRRPRKHEQITRETL